MSDRIKFWCFILLIPTIMAIAHDIYANASMQRETAQGNFQIDPTTYKVSDLGYLLTTYTPSFYENTRSAMGEEMWTSTVDPVLRQHSFVIAFIPAGLFYVYLLLARLLNLPPFRYIMPDFDPGADKLDRRNREQKFKYNRR